MHQAADDGYREDPPEVRGAWVNEEVPAGSDEETEERDTSCNLACIPKKQKSLENDS